MILGMSTAAFTTVHVALSLIGLAAGFIVVFGMIRSRILPAWNGVFLATTALTSLTGFLFPFKQVTPGIVVGILSMVVLILAALALYLWHLAGRWRGTYVISAVLALFFNFLALIAQSFEKIPAERPRPDYVRSPISNRPGSGSGPFRHPGGARIQAISHRTRGPLNHASPAC